MDEADVSVLGDRSSLETGWFRPSRILRGGVSSPKSPWTNAIHLHHFCFDEGTTEKVHGPLVRGYGFDAAIWSPWLPN